MLLLGKGCNFSRAQVRFYTVTHPTHSNFLKIKAKDKQQGREFQHQENGAGDCSYGYRNNYKVHTSTHPPMHWGEVGGGGVMLQCRFFKKKFWSKMPFLGYSSAGQVPLPHKYAQESSGSIESGASPWWPPWVEVKLRGEGSGLYSTASNCQAAGGNKGELRLLEIGIYPRS